MATTMLLENNLPTYFWDEAVSNILNKFNLRQGIKKTPSQIKSLLYAILEPLDLNVIS